MLVELSLATMLAALVTLYSMPQSVKEVIQRYQRKEGPDVIVNVEMLTEGFDAPHTRHPVVVELFSPRANADDLSQALIELANAAGGQYLLARVMFSTPS